MQVDFLGMNRNTLRKPSKKVLKGAICAYTLTSFILPLLGFVLLGHSEIYNSFQILDLFKAVIAVTVLLVVLVKLVDVKFVSDISSFVDNLTPRIGLNYFAWVYSLSLVFVISCLLFSGVVNSDLLASRYRADVDPATHLVLSISIIASTCSTLYYIYLYSESTERHYDLIVRFPLFLSLLLQALLILGLGSAARLVFAFGQAFFPKLTASILFSGKIRLRLGGFKISLLARTALFVIALLLTVFLAFTHGISAKNHGTNLSSNAEFEFVEKNTTFGHYAIGRLSTSFYSAVHALADGNREATERPGYMPLLNTASYRLDKILGISSKKITPTFDGLNALTIGNYAVDPYKEGTSPGIYAFWLYLINDSPFLALPLTATLLAICLIVYSIALVHLSKSGPVRMLNKPIFALLYSRILASVFFASPSSALIILDDTFLLLAAFSIFVILLPDRHRG